MLPAVLLKNLILEGRSEEAAALCRTQLQKQPDSRYYRFWLDRLAGSGSAPESAIASASPTSGQTLKRALVERFAQSGYRIAPPPRLEGDLAQMRARIVGTIPFRSEIYLPTAKVPESDQVVGLSRVHSLVQKDNLDATRQRFDALKDLLRTLGKDRIFVIGNGPSLKRTDLSLLKDEVTIGFNGIFLHDSFKPTIYVVEDHLVAEDRKDEIHAYDCFVKVFPSYLGYCIEPQENTIFLNHRPRISYPVDTDFSADAGNITYTGGTVTYTGLQLAASLGFREIILVGVDASYSVHDVERSDSYGTGVLTSKSDDANHFDPRYFGKGYRWHDPNVNTMLQAYRKVRNFSRARGVRVVNATLGGQLEVFPRVDFHDLFARNRVFPRLAVLDFTAVTQLCATGIVKKNLLAGWPVASQFHSCAPNEGRLVAFQSIAHDLYAVRADEGNPWAAFRSLVEFDPEVLYLRPTHDRVAMTALQIVAASVLDRPWTVHYMDDWLEKAKTVRTPEVAAAYRVVMGRLFVGAARVFSICEKMSGFLVSEFGVAADRVVVAHNYLPAGGPVAATRKPKGDGPVVIRYMGGLEPDMGLASLVELSRRVDAHNRRPGARQVVLEIHSNDNARKRHGALFAGHAGTRLSPPIGDYTAYLEALAGSDLNLVCYNFDNTSLDYVRYSLANKLPELLAAGAPFLAIGHPEIGTMQVLREAGYPLVVESEDYDLARLVEDAVAPDAEAVSAYEAAISALRQEFSDERNRFGFQRALREAATMPTAGLRGRALPLAELARLCEASKASLAATRDMDCLLRLPLVDRAVLEPALALVRSHGLDWSIRTSFEPLKAACKDAATLASQSDAVRAQALAFLICSLGGETHQAVNNTVRAWLLASHPLPASGA